MPLRRRSTPLRPQRLRLRPNHIAERPSRDDRVERIAGHEREQRFAGVAEHGKIGLVNDVNRSNVEALFGTTRRLEEDLIPQLQVL